MRRQNNKKVGLTRLAPLAIFLLALQTPGAPVHAKPPAQSQTSCTKTVATNMYGGFQTILDDAKKDDPVCKAAVATLKAASVIVIGDAADNDTLVSRLIGVASSPAWKAKFEEGLKFADAVAYLKARIAAGGAADRAKAIDNAFMEVFGRPSNPQEQALYETKVKAQQAWYATIVGELNARLRENAFARQGAIVRAYKAVFGREPTPAESQYWQARGEHYRQIREHGRNWLYSSEGAKDLAETVARALQFKAGLPPPDTHVKQAMAKYTQHKLIYDEMVK